MALSQLPKNIYIYIYIFFFYIIGNRIATFVKIFFFFFFTFSAMGLPQLPKYFILFFYYYFFFTFSAIGLPQLPFFFFLTFSAMPLPQLICHKFFELIIINHVWFIVKILWTWQLFFLLIHRFHNFFFPFSAMALPQLPKQFFFFFFFYIFGNAIATINLSQIFWTNNN